MPKTSSASSRDARTPRRTMRQVVAAAIPRFPGLRFEIGLVSYTPYRKPRGLRYRTWTGKRRTATGVSIYEGNAVRPSYEWNPLEPNRTVADLVAWLDQYKREHR